MKKYFTLFILTTFLFSCSQTDKTQPIVDQKIKKIPFYIETKDLWEFSNEVLFQKSAKLVSTSEISVNSQASGKISKINFQVWDSVKIGQNLVTLEDNISNYYTSLERARNALERTKINYDSSIISLDKNISDAQINYDKLKKSHELLLLDSDEKLKKLNIDTGDADINVDASKAKMDFEKAQLDFENTLLNDQNQINTFIENTKTAHKNLVLTYFDVMNFLDEIFGVTQKNQHRKDDYEIYLSAKNSTFKALTENKLTSIIAWYDSFKNKDFSSMNEDNLIENIEYIEQHYLLLKDVLDISKEAFKNSIDSTIFPKTQIDGYFNQASAYGTNISGWYTAFISSKSAISAFLNTYKQAQQSRQEQLAILEKQFDINKNSLESSVNRTKIEIENSILNSETAVKTAKNNLDNAIKNKEVTLKSLKNSIKEAEIALSESQKNAGKLIVKAPISWVISKKSVDIWQEVSLGSSLFTIVWDNMTKVEIYLSSDEKQMVSIWDNVKVKYFNNELSGKIESISPVASKDFTYLTTIAIWDKVDIIWDFVEVMFLTKSENILLPVSILKIIWNNKAVINILENGKNVSIEIQIGQIFWNEVEVISGLSQTHEIIITDINNYNENDFELVKK